MILYLCGWKVAVKSSVCQVCEVIAGLEMTLTLTFKHWLAGRASF